MIPAFAKSAGRAPCAWITPPTLSGDCATAAELEELLCAHTPGGPVLPQPRLRSQRSHREPRRDAPDVALQKARLQSQSASSCLRCSEERWMRSRLTCGRGRGRPAVSAVAPVLSRTCLRARFGSRIFCPGNEGCHRYPRRHVQWSDRPRRPPC